MVGVTVVVLLHGVAGGLLAVVVLGFHRAFAELAMLFGIGGWPGRLAAGQLCCWAVLMAVVAQPTGGWLVYTVIAAALLATLALPFYVNNRSLLSAIAAPTDQNRSDADLTLVSGRISLDPDAGPVEPVTAPFSGTECAAYEWAIKSRRRLSRRAAYTTLDSGEGAGTFLVDTAADRLLVDARDPTLLLVFGPGVTGYERSFTDPTPDVPQDSDAGDRFGATRYYETTLGAGDAVTVVGQLEGDRIGPSKHDSLWIVDAEHERLKRAVDRYLRWTPHVGVGAFLVSWLYLGWYLVL